MKVIFDFLKTVFTFVGDVIDFIKTFVLEFPSFLIDVVGLGNLPHFVKSWIGMLATLIIALAIIKLVSYVREATV